MLLLDIPIVKPFATPPSIFAYLLLQTSRPMRGGSENSNENLVFSVFAILSNISTDLHHAEVESKGTLHDLFHDFCPTTGPNLSADCTGRRLTSRRTYAVNVAGTHLPTTPHPEKSCRVTKVEWAVFNAVSETKFPVCMVNLSERSTPTFQSV